MTRQQARQNLINIGIEEPTDEQISNYLNQVNGETQKANDKADRWKAEADKSAELQKQLDEIQNQNLSDIEKANKVAEEANARAEKAEGTIKMLTLRNSLADNGITGEDADSLIESLSSGNFDAGVLGKIIADRETKAMAKKEQELLDRTPNPNGGKSGSGEEKTSAEQIAESVGKSLSGNNSNSADIISSYIK